MNTLTADFNLKIAPHSFHLCLSFLHASSLWIEATSQGINKSSMKKRINFSRRIELELSTRFGCSFSPYEEYGVCQCTFICIHTYIRTQGACVCVCVSVCTIITACLHFVSAVVLAAYVALASCVRSSSSRDLKQPC